MSFVSRSLHAPLKVLCVHACVFGGGEGGCFLVQTREGVLSVGLFVYAGKSRVVWTCSGSKCASVCMPSCFLDLYSPA